MNDDRDERRRRRHNSRASAEIAALEAERLRLNNGIKAAKASEARLKAARQDAITASLDINTMERLDFLTIQLISQNIRNRASDISADIEVRKTR